MTRSITVGTIGAIASGARTCWAGVLDLLLPNVCAACSAADAAANGLCQECADNLLAMAALAYCKRCGSATGPNVPEHWESCPACPATLPRFDRVIRLGSYAPPLRSVIRHLKYRRQEMLRGYLGKLLAAAIDARCDHPLDLALSIPMHWRRRLTRGYDHARMIARTVARELDLPLGHELFRVRHTPPQAHLTRTRRIENMRGAFAVTSPATIRGAKILLVDDVTTTGATADEATRTLLEAGASSVTLAVLAKSEPPKAYAEFRGDKT